MDSQKKRRLWSMIGEIFREIGVLILALSPLEYVLSHGQLTVLSVVVTLMISVPMLALGLLLGLVYD